ncbi:unnamed protein product [Prorocentrum cordatum]|uniref:Uncharacterized protein n=1 Tax=Prorocentrum cordatum TaxID=2364126 RepID=A0ABN9UFR7_9DINO|nr:unnamed protein product [Polarella glacialis]
MWLTALQAVSRSGAAGADELPTVVLAGARGSGQRRLLAALADRDEEELERGAADGVEAQLENRYYTARVRYRLVDIDRGSALLPGARDALLSADALVLLWDLADPDAFSSARTALEEAGFPLAGGDSPDSDEEERVLLCVAVESGAAAAAAGEEAEEVARGWCAERGLEHLRCGLGVDDLEPLRRRRSRASSGAFGGLLGEDTDGTPLRILEALECHQWPNLQRRAGGGAPGGGVAGSAGPARPAGAPGPVRPAGASARVGRGCLGWEAFCNRFRGFLSHLVGPPRRAAAQREVSAHPRVLAGGSPAEQLPRLSRRAVQEQRPCTEPQAGDRVEFHGLSGRADLNGRAGAVRKFVAEKQRFAVVPEGDQEAVLVQAKNIRKVGAACHRSEEVPLVAFAASAAALAHARAVVGALAGASPGEARAECSTGGQAVLETKYYRARLWLEAFEAPVEDVPAWAASAAGLVLLWDTGRPETFARVRRLFEAAWPAAGDLGGDGGAALKTVRFLSAAQRQVFTLIHREFFTSRCPAVERATQVIPREAVGSSAWQVALVGAGRARSARYLDGLAAVAAGAPADHQAVAVFVAAEQRCLAELDALIKELRRLRAGQLPLHQELGSAAVQLLRDSAAVSGEQILTQWSDIIGTVRASAATSAQAIRETRDLAQLAEKGDAKLWTSLAGRAAVMLPPEDSNALTRMLALFLRLPSGQRPGSIRLISPIPLLPGMTLELVAPGMSARDWLCLPSMMVPGTCRGFCSPAPLISVPDVPILLMDVPALALPQVLHAVMALPGALYRDPRWWQSEARRTLGRASQDALLCDRVEGAKDVGLADAPFLESNFARGAGYKRSLRLYASRFSSCSRHVRSHLTLRHPTLKPPPTAMERDSKQKELEVCEGNVDALPVSAKAKCVDPTTVEGYVAAETSVRQLRQETHASKPSGTHVHGLGNKFQKFDQTAAKFKASVEAEKKAIATKQQTVIELEQQADQKENARVQLQLEQMGIVQYPILTWMRNREVLFGLPVKKSAARWDGPRPPEVFEISGPIFPSIFGFRRPRDGQRNDPGRRRFHTFAQRIQTPEGVESIAYGEPDTKQYIAYLEGMGRLQSATTRRRLGEASKPRRQRRRRGPPRRAESREFQRLGRVESD